MINMSVSIYYLLFETSIVSQDKGEYWFTNECEE